VLQYLGVDVTLAALHARYYRPDPNSALAMAGAGTSAQILNEYAFDEGYKVEVLNTGTKRKADVVTEIATSIRADLPVIATIRSDDILGFGHALLITGIDPQSGTVIFKDPGCGTSSRPFAIDVKHVPYETFITKFRYGHSNSMYLDVDARCTRITLLKRYELGSLFD
jgi:hypothetical protein